MARHHWSGVVFATLVLANGCGPFTTPRTPPGKEGAMRVVVLHVDGFKKSKSGAV
jgi:hypothetical protein